MTNKKDYNLSLAEDILDEVEGDIMDGIEFDKILVNKNKLTKAIEKILDQFEEKIIEDNAVSESEPDRDESRD